MSVGAQPQRAVIFDIDRTLADIAPFEHLFSPELESGYWRAFHEAAVNAPVIDWVAAEVEYARANGLSAIAVTARPQMHRDVTLEWFSRTGLAIDEVYLRPDERLHWSDVDAKRAMLTSIRAWFTPVHAFEDKPDVAAMWESEGIPTTLVAGHLAPVR